jgi:hypothetical protein
MHRDRESLNRIWRLTLIYDEPCAISKDRRRRLSECFERALVRVLSPRRQEWRQARQAHPREIAMLFGDSKSIARA